MPTNEAAFRELLDKEAIRDLVLLYSRAIDRKDVDLLRDLYTDDATDSHGDSFDGPADKYCDFIAASLPYMTYSGHHGCNHLIPDGQGGQLEDLMAVRYIDNYRRCADGKWRFSKRVVTYDMKLQRPFTGGGLMALGEKDPSYAVCPQRLFQRGPRA